MVPQTDTHLQVALKFAPLADGITFHLSGAFYDAVPTGSPRLPVWTGLPTNAPLDHAEEGEIEIERICGPFEKLDTNTFALRLERENTTNESRYELVFAARHPGDAHFKPAVQQAHMFVPSRNLQGLNQQLTFPPIPDRREGAGSIRLPGGSDAGLPVHYYVREGPAEVEGDQLIFTAIPPRAKWPVKVTVVAWQYGRTAEPRVKSAVPVERSFFIYQ